MVGIGFNQTLQLNVISLPNGPCRMQLAIFDSNGATVASRSVGPPQTIGFEYGRLKIDYKNQVSGFPQRKQFRAEVTLQPTTTSPCQAQATVEVFDNFSNTDWVLAQGLQPQPPPNMPIGPVGLIFEQTARLNVVALPSGPCFGTLGFIDVAGNPVGSQSAVSLAAGQATFLDLPGQTIVHGFGQRQEVLGVFTPSATVPAPRVCVLSVEVFDQLTGYTRVLVPQPPPVIPQPPPN